MRYKISVYSQDAFKEILLPAVNNADSSVVLYKDIYGLEDDLVLSMEVVDHQWKFNSVTEYRIEKEGKDYTGCIIRHNDVLSLVMRDGKILSMLVAETQNTFSVYAKYHLPSQVTIGSDAGNHICYKSLRMVSKAHAILEVDEQGCLVRDRNSANGVFVNSRRIQGAQRLQFGDSINILGLVIVYLGKTLAIDTGAGNLTVNESVLRPFVCKNGNAPALQTGRQKEKDYFHRVPRNMEKIEDGEIEIDAPPPAARLQMRSALMTVGPAMTMAVPMLLGCSLAIFAARSSGSASVFMYTGIVTAVASAVLGTFWALLNMNRQKKEVLLQEQQRMEMYTGYLNECEHTLDVFQKQNGKALNHMYPSAEDCALYNRSSVLLWNRNATHKDFLFQRLGMGDIPFQMEIKIPKKRFTVENDMLAKRPQELKDTFGTLREVPVGVDLKEHPLIGVVGGAQKRGAYQVAKCMIAQLAANNCYTDVKIGLLYDKANGREAENLGCVKWLPHVWSEDHKTRFVADTRTDAGDVLYEITKILRKRADEAQEHPQRKSVPKPHYVLFITEPSLLEGELITKYILGAKDTYGLTTVLLVEEYEDLPNACEYIVQNDNKYRGFYTVGNDPAKQQSIVFDDISSAKLEAFARRLSAIEVNEVETGGEIPSGLSFLEMYQAERIEDLQIENRWKKNRTYDSMKALIGQRAGGLPCYLDIHEKYHGPHGLVAGTTGSGKSELLQTYILSLAVNYSPDDIGFFIIDYKGGGMANLFSGLPHMMGQISNLSGNQVRRAMVSIKSENRRRQRLFNEHSVNSINQYTRLYKGGEASVPIPHLFIIIDEFAELKREEPDFMRELISVAQVGRSLGVHLILATQKPSGTVDDNIWSNSKFRMCLRVQDRQDSNDMLHKPDAAYLTQAGRCYLQVGNDELYEMFQSGYSGAAYDDMKGAGKTDIVKMFSLTGKAALVGNRMKIKQKERSRRQWFGLLAGILEGAFQTEGGQAAEICVDSARMEKVYDTVFETLLAKGVDYPDTEYNRRRLGELAELYIVALERNYRKPEDIAAFIMAAAALQGSKLPELKEKTQLDAVVEHLQRLAKEQGYEHNYMLWLPILPEKLCLGELPGFQTGCFDGSKWLKAGSEATLHAIVGLCDDPVNQAQMPLAVDLAKNGHYAVCGTVASGKSTFLQTLLFSIVCSYTPDAVNIYGIDFGSRMMAPFEGLAHVGGVMYENDADKTAKFFNMMKTVLKERKALLKGGNYIPYIQAHGTVLPAIVIAVDQYANFREKTKNSYEDILMQIARDGAGYGIYLVITAGGFGSVEIQNRIGDNIKNVICLEMSDKYQYTEAMRMIHFDVLPENGVKGRGLAKAGGSILEFQTALALDAEDDYERADRITEVCRRMNAAWNGEIARPIPSIPQKPRLSDFLQIPEVRKAAEEGRYLPVGYNMESADIFRVDISQIFCFLISGKARTGKTDLMKIMMEMSAMSGANLCVVDSFGGLRRIAGKLDAVYVTEEQELFNYLKTMVSVFRERNAVKRALLEEGAEDEEIYERMRNETPYFLFIDDLVSFVTMAVHPREGVPDMKGFLENITDKGSLHNVYFVACFNQDDAVQLAGIRLYENMIRYKTGIHLGGNVAAQRIFSFDQIPYHEQSRPLAAGIGLVPALSQAVSEQKVVLPFAGKANGGRV